MTSTTTFTSTAAPARTETRPKLVRAGLATTLVVALGAGSLATVAPAQAAPAGPARAAAVSPADAQLVATLKSRLGAAALGTDVAVRVYDPTTRKTVFAAQSTEAQIPASNMKLVTAYTALKSIGAATRFPTKVVRGTKKNRIVLVGGGDPLLSSADLRTLARRTATGLAASSTSSVKLYVNDTLFAKPTRAKGWTSSYGLGEISPVRALGRHGVASSDTTRDAQLYFASQLRSTGVKVTVAGRTSRKSGTKVAKVAGRRVDAAVRAALLVSDNQVAETLFRQVAVRNGRAGTWSGAAKASRAVLKKAGVPMAGLRIVDGSGLSRSNRVTAASLVKIVHLASSSKSKQLRSFVPSLAVAGRSGTLAGRFWSATSSCARGRVQAKSGFLNGVVSLSGVASGVDGKRRVFSIVANNIPSSRYSVPQTQAAVDDLAAAVTGCR
jgi:serine-type D-Ala-D-Ala carboxypeptidase/endopeptidase (penicillin-binding protein 4)